MQLKIHWNLVFEELGKGLVRELKLAAPKHTDELRKSIKAKASDKALEIYMIDYAIFVEMGSLPHWTSVKHLKKWAKDKWGDEKLAYALQAHIAKCGTKPSYFMRETIKQKVPEMLAKALKYPGAVEIIH